MRSQARPWIVQVSALSIVRDHAQHRSWTGAGGRSIVCSANKTRNVARWGQRICGAVGRCGLPRRSAQVTRSETVDGCQTLAVCTYRIPPALHGLLHCRSPCSLYSPCSCIQLGKQVALHYGGSCLPTRPAAPRGAGVCIPLFLYAINDRKRWPLGLWGFPTRPGSLERTGLRILLACMRVRETVLDRSVKSGAGGPLSDWLIPLPCLSMCLHIRFARGLGCSRCGRSVQDHAQRSEHDPRRVPGGTLGRLSVGARPSEARRFQSTCV